MSVFRWFQRKARVHPRAFLHSLLTYPRFLGRIKPELMKGREQEILVRLEALDRRWEAAWLSCPVGKRLLVIAPHPDDESVGIGGLLLAHRGKCEVHILNVFNGEGGGRLPESPWCDNLAYRQRLTEVRQAELAEAGKILGVQSIEALGLKDGQTMPNQGDAERIREVVERIKPDVVLIPWFFDNQRDHRVANILYAWSCGAVECVVLGFEIWRLCQPNACFDFTPWLDEKIRLVNVHATQTATIDYSAYVQGLARTRAFLNPAHATRTGAVEAIFALPNRDYCELVQSFYGQPYQLSPAGQGVL